MIIARVWKRNGQYRGYEVSGHAGYAESGYDIICAAVSVLAQNTANAIEAFTDDAFSCELSEEDGYLRIDFPEPLGERASLLMDSLVLGFTDIEAAYGQEYMTLNLEEV